MIKISSHNWELNNITGIIFDKDGTLINSHIYWGRIIHYRTIKILEHYQLSKSLYSDISKAMGFCTVNKKLLPEGPIAILSREEVINFLNKYLNKLGINSDENAISKIFSIEHAAFNNDLKDYIKPLPGVINMLKQLKEKNIVMAIVTSDTIENTNKTLDILGLNNYFDLILGKDSTKESKKTGVPAIKAMKMLNILPENTVCIGDAPMDLLMAKNSNSYGIGVSSGQLSIEALKKYSDFTVNSLEELTIKPNHL